MRGDPLLSTSRQGETLVMSSILAVFERIDLSLVEAILQAATGESSLQMVRFTRQPPGVGASTPGGLITARFAYWFEVKTERNALRPDQLREHLRNLGDRGDERLFIVTPDGGCPATIDDVADDRVLWCNFRSLSDAIDAVIADGLNVMGERIEFLLRELQALFENDGLLDAHDVVVVEITTLAAASIAVVLAAGHSAGTCGAVGDSDRASRSPVATAWCSAWTAASSRSSSGSRTPARSRSA